MTPPIPKSSPLWPLRYVHPPETWIRCVLCWTVGRLPTMRQVEQIRRWASTPKNREMEIEPHKVWVCREPDDACRRYQMRYCREL